MHESRYNKRICRTPRFLFHRLHVKRSSTLFIEHMSFLCMSHVIKKKICRTQRFLFNRLHAERSSPLFAEDMSFLCMSHVIKKKICGTQRFLPVLAAREKKPDCIGTTHVISLNESRDSFWMSRSTHFDWVTWHISSGRHELIIEFSSLWVDDMGWLRSVGSIKL